MILQGEMLLLGKESARSVGGELVGLSDEMWVKSGCVQLIVGIRRWRPKSVLSYTTELLG